MATSKVPSSRIIDGLKFPSLFDEGCIRRGLWYEPRDDDIFLITFPKCGTTWTQQILYLIFRHGIPPADYLELNIAVPFLDVCGPEVAETMRRPGAMKGHYPYHMTPYSAQAKYIYVARNPKDCCVSFYHHYKKLITSRFTGTFDDFFEVFITGDTDYGDYFDHLLGWYSHRRDPNVLFLTYENMKANPSTSVLKIAEFLGGDYLAKLQHPDLLNRILVFSDFDYMKTIVSEGIDRAMNVSLEELHKMELRPIFIEMHKRFRNTFLLTGGGLSGAYTRKGIVGDWKNYFSPEQNQRMEERIKEKTAGSDVMNLWKDIDGL